MTWAPLSSGSVGDFPFKITILDTTLNLLLKLQLHKNFISCLEYVWKGQNQRALLAQGIIG